MLCTVMHFKFLRIKCEEIRGLKIIGCYLQITLKTIFWPTSHKVMEHSPTSPISPAKHHKTPGFGLASRENLPIHFSPFQRHKIFGPWRCLLRHLHSDIQRSDSFRCSSLASRPARNGNDISQLLTTRASAASLLLVFIGFVWKQNTPKISCVFIIFLILTCNFGGPSSISATPNTWLHMQHIIMGWWRQYYLNPKKHKHIVQTSHKENLGSFLHSIDIAILRKMER